MFGIRRRLSLLLSVSAFLSILPMPKTVPAQDLVATETVSGGSSVFVFRESRKKPQARGASAFVGEASGGGSGSGASGKARSSRTNTQIASAASKRRAAAAKRRAAMVAAANRKIALSNTL